MARLYVEGGGDSKELRIRCREAFSKLLVGAGFRGRMPRLKACGGRRAAFDDFCTAARHAPNEFVALIVDSEEPVADGERPWEHLERPRDGWRRPSGVGDHQALLMITSMETWIAADPSALRARFKQHTRISHLPPVAGIEGRTRAEILQALERATADCQVQYGKGAVSFEVLALVSAEALSAVPSFARMKRVLGVHLPPHQSSQRIEQPLRGARRSQRRRP
jgi:hypothetical protein